MAQLAFEHEEALRQDRLKALIEERRRLEEVARAGSRAVRAAAGEGPAQCRR